MTLSLRRKRPTTARTNRPSTAATDPNRESHPISSPAVQNGLTFCNLNFVVLRLACLLLTFQTIGLVPSLIESSSSATAAQVGSSTQATWLPPVHVAPQRRPSENGSPTQASPNELYPGVFDPDQSPQQPASGRFADQTVSPRGFVPNSQGRSATPFGILAFATFGSKVVVYATPLDFNIVEV